MTQAFALGFHEAIDPGLIDPSPHQNRAFPENWPARPDQAEFIANIAAIGVQQPIVCRPHPTKPDRLLLVAGERRLRATRSAGLPGIPVMVKELSDDEAATITVSENHHREDLTPMEEAHGVETLLKVHQGDAQAVAAKLGQTTRWVRLRARLLTLIPEWQDAASPGNWLERWTAAHLELIARFDAETQSQLLEDLTHWQAPNWSVADLDRHLGQYLQLLRKAPWKLDDETLCPEAGSCEACAKRTDHDRQQGLFDEDGVDPEKVKRNARCLDVACWQAKSDAFLKRAVDEARQQYEGLIVVANDYLSPNRFEALEEFTGPILREYQWDNSKKSAKDSVPALVVCGKGMGKVRWVTVDPFYLNTDSSRPVDPATGKPKPKPLKERRAELDSKRWCQVLVELREKLADTTAMQVAAAVLGLDGEVVEISPEESLTVAATLAAAFGTINSLSSVHAYDSRTMERGKPWDDFDANITGWPDNYDDGAVAETLWRQVAQVLQGRLKYDGPITQLNKDYIDEARHTARLIGVDVDALLAEISTRKGFTEPKSWAKLKADGTPKKAKKKASKKGGAA